MNWTHALMTAWAWWELALYDGRITLGGFPRIHRNLERQGVKRTCARRTPESICAAVDLALCLYLKRVHCLQRSVVMVRMMRRHGIAATLVIAYRPAPFFAHAWAEVEGRVVNDSPGYAERLTTLYRQAPEDAR